LTATFLCGINDGLVRVLKIPSPHLERGPSEPTGRPGARMIQLPDLSLVAVAALFWATYWVLRQTVFRPLGGIFEEREMKVASATDALSKALEKEKETLADIDRRFTEARREAMAGKDTARTQAGARRQEALDAAREKARAAAADAQRGLDAEVAAARDQLRHEAYAMATEIASRTLGRKIA
jgi:F0F1-type ATP synthase membrane subunit b/b'